MPIAWQVIAILISTAATVACGAEVHQAVLSLQAEEEHLPCLGLRRLRVTVFQNEVDGKSSEEFGSFYLADGQCLLPASLAISLVDLPYGERMWVQVEAFDSSQKRRLSLGQTELIEPSDIKSGQLGTVLLRRESVADAFPTGTLVMEPLPGMAEIDEINELTFLINPGEDQINGHLIRDPALPWHLQSWVLSSLAAQTIDTILIVARKGGQPLGQWQNAETVVIGPEDLLVPARLTRTQ